MHPLKKLQSRWLKASPSEQQEWANLQQLLTSTDREVVQSGCALLAALEWDSAVATLLTQTGEHCGLEREWFGRHVDLIAAAVLNAIDHSEEPSWNDLEESRSLDSLRLFSWGLQTLSPAHSEYSKALSMCKQERRIPSPIGHFWMHQYPVTQLVWESVSKDNPSSIVGATRPVTNVSWVEALQFCNRLSEENALTPCYRLSKDEHNVQPDPTIWDQQADGFRLPTEAEWVIAAQANQTHSFAGADSIDDVGWANKRFQLMGASTLPPVGQQQPNAFGLFDMCGTTFELCWDGEINDRSLRRVKKGGGWCSSAQACQIDSRYCAPIDGRGSILGFRIVRNAAPTVLQQR